MAAGVNSSNAIFDQCLYDKNALRMELDICNKVDIRAAYKVYIKYIQQQIIFQLENELTSHRRNTSICLQRWNASRLEIEAFMKSSVQSDEYARALSNSIVKVRVKNKLNLI